MPAKQPKINLLPQEEFEASTLGRVLNWTLSSFRIIVILTEMVVILAFLSRFWLDARVTDLNEVIKRQGAIISAQAASEKEFRLLQKRLKIVSSMAGIQTPTATFISTVTSLLPPDVSLTGFVKNDNFIEIIGTSTSERSVSQLLSNLEASSIFKEVSLENTRADNENGSILVFTIKLTIKEGGNT